MAAELRVGVSGDPPSELRIWAAGVAPYLRRCWPSIAACLWGPATPSTPSLSIDFVPLTRDLLVAWTGQAYGPALEHPERVAAVTEGRTIHVNASYLLPRIDQADMVGMMVHETAHVAQGYPAGVCTWMKEGLADYVRYYVVRPFDPGRAFDPDQQIYSDGFAPAAGMLAWIEARHRNAVRRLNFVMHGGGDGIAELHAITGQPPEALWTAYLQARSHR